jgi:putative ABC transport system permease protein
MIETLLRDLRFALRSVRQRPGFAVVTVITLGLGIGANTAIFSVVNGVLLRALPYVRPDRLTMIWGHWQLKERAELSESEFWDMREQVRSFQRIAAFAPGSANLTGVGTAERVMTGYMTADALPLLGVAPALGRTFTVDEDLPGRPAVVLLSDGLWRRRFGADRKIIGRQVLLDDAPTTVIGVMPEGFQLPLNFVGIPMDAWAPLALDPAADRSERGFHYLLTIGRLRDGVTLEQADREVSGLMTRMKETYQGKYAPEFNGSVTAVPEQVTGAVRPTLLVLLGAVALLLLIACANVAGLLLARSEGRAREIALRTALGAARGRLIRQLLTESALLAVVGGVLGLVLAAWGSHLLILAAPPSIPRLESVSVDGRVLAFTAAVSLLAGLLFGVAPAIHSVGMNVNRSLAEGGRGGTGGRPRQRLRRGLVVGQIALALMLVSASGLLVQSFRRLRQVDPGFDPEHVLTARVDLGPVRYQGNRDIWGFYRELVRRVAALPGVQSAAIARALPMTGRLDIGDWSFVREGHYSIPITPADRSHADWQVVTPDYFRTMRIPVRAGRAFDERDVIGAPGVIIVNQALASEVWPQGDAIGKRVLLGGGSIDSVWRTVVGMVGDVRHRGLDAAARPEIYLPEAQYPAGTGTAARSLYLAIRTVGDPSALANPLRSTLRGLDPDVPLAEVQTLEQALGSWAAERRLTMLVVSCFAMLALTLGAIGIYGVMTYFVSQRTREIGIRIALGALPREIVRLVLSQGVWLAAIGILAGLAGALVTTRLLGSMLFQVHPNDPPTHLVTALALALVALVATLLPALRATRVDPIESMRSE